MNKRIERINIAKTGLMKMYNEIKNARFDGGDIVIELENGYVFFIQGFTSKTSFEELYKEAKNEESVR